MSKIKFVAMLYIVALAGWVFGGGTGVPILGVVGTAVGVFAHRQLRRETG